MTTRSIKRKRDDGMLPPNWQAPGERAPSVIRGDQPTVSRSIAFTSLLIVAVGALAVVLSYAGSRTLLSIYVGFGWGVFLLGLGMVGLLFHAFNETDLQLRRGYGLLGLILLGLGAFFLVMPFRPAGAENYTPGALFLPAGAPAFGLALAFLLAYVRQETRDEYRAVIQRIVAVTAAGLILIGVIGGVIREDFLMGTGVVCLLLAWMYAAAFIGLQSLSSSEGYYAGLALGAVGVLMIVIALGKSLPLAGLNMGWVHSGFGWVRWVSGQPGAPFLFTYVGIEYLLLAVGVCSESQLVILTRREVGAYFFSPIAYLVLVSFAFLGGCSFFVFTSSIWEQARFGGALEPIFPGYIFGLVSLFSVVLVVPVITMRLLSEEQRSGTMEVLLTAPVRESTIVISKFLAALRFFLLTWYPWGLYLVALRVAGGAEFDYRPVLSFAIVLAVTGAGFVSMGLFFSSLTKNQIIAAVLTLIGMIIPVFIYFVNDPQTIPSQAVRNVLSYVNFIDVWIQGAFGLLSPRYLFFHISATIFWLFLTVKVLESRKWR